QQFGIEDPGRPYRMTVVGGWTAEDFEEQRRREKTFEVTDMVTGPGTYTVGFRYTSGWNGLRSYAVELIEAAGDDSEGGAVVASDEHEGTAGARPENTQYTLEVEDVHPEARYFIRVDIQGTPDTGLPADRQGCNGDIWMRKAGKLDAGQPPPPLRPMTEDQAAAFGPPRFVTDGVHVAVLPGGYGASAIQQWLAEREGVEVRPLSGLTPAHLKPCDVIILPQPKMAGVIGEDDVRALRGYVRDGGGLIVTHDSVGFREQPAIIPEICAGGVEKIDARHWIAVAQHPVTAGIELNVEHTHSYYDHIQLEAGPDAVVLAKGAEREMPVVVAGSFGEGRYVAIGLAVGIDDDAMDVAPRGAEAQLLLNAVTWAGGGS
ncbi:MAG: ThuA domain-containing protein, partial [Armatimonadota bacterium]